MTRAEDIDNLIRERETDFTQAWVDDLHNWLIERNDAELVEMLRGVASTLAWRRVTLETNPFANPSMEVFETSLKQVAQVFKESMDR
jgi:hypothetical protein